MPFKREGSPHYHYDRTITVAGRRYRVRGSTGETSKTRAKEIEEHAVRAERDRIMHGDDRQHLTLDQALGTYAANVAMYQPSWRTTQSQSRALLASLQRTTPLDTITTATLTEHTARRRAAAANATVNRELQLLRRVLSYAQKNLNAAVPDIDWKALTLREPRERVRELTADEEQRLFANLREDFHPLVRFCLITGCRVGSAIKLEWRDVDLRARALTFREMKGGEHHAIPLSATLVLLLANLPKAEGCDRVFLYKFRGKQLRPFTAAGWKKPWWDALEAARIPDFRFHDLRHTALSRMTRARGIAAAQKLAGHADITTTSRYAHVQMADLLEAMEIAESTHNRPTPRKA
ncbi:site-specific integrase [Oceanicella sp. SM1341]|uniref:site-specific integrase n=1 Tax=Oceanicella sp. SM1341 TaxID=1548889 RepID=UPI001E54DE95|nr:site-specific integrase [Oceanicella sp. SM1341]